MRWDRAGQIARGQLGEVQNEGCVRYGAHLRRNQSNALLECDQLFS